MNRPPRRLVQVIHQEVSVGMHKADSAARACAALNPSITIEVHRDGFNPVSAPREPSALKARWKREGVVGTEV